MSKIKAIIFDLDGTLIDSVTDLANSVNYSLRQLDMTPHSREEVKSFVGDGVAKLIKRSLGQADLAKFDQAYAIFMDHYGEHCLDNTVLYPGVENILPELAKQYSLAVLTNKSVTFSNKILKALGVASRFREVIGGDSLEAKKPAADGIFYLADKWGIDPVKEMLMVGDHATDIEVGRRAGCRTVFINGGIGVRRGLVPDYAIDSMLELPDLLARL